MCEFSLPFSSQKVSRAPGNLKNKTETAGGKRGCALLLRVLHNVCSLEVVQGYERVAEDSDPPSPPSCARVTAIASVATCFSAIHIVPYRGLFLLRDVKAVHVFTTSSQRCGEFGYTAVSCAPVLYNSAVARRRLYGRTTRPSLGLGRPCSVTSYAIVLCLQALGFCGSSSGLLAVEYQHNPRPTRVGLLIFASSTSNCLLEQTGTRHDTFTSSSCPTSLCARASAFPAFFSPRAGPRILGWAAAKKQG